MNTRNSCPICDCPSHSKPNFTIKNPYVRCDSCSFMYQINLVDKVYEAHHEVSGDLMSEADKRVNADLAGWLLVKYEALSGK